MRNLNYFLLKLIPAIALTSLILVGCGGTDTPVEELPSPQAEIVVPPTTEPPPEVSEPAKLILWAAPETDPNLFSQVQPILQSQADAQGLLVEVQQALTPETLAGDIRLVVALPPASNLGELVIAVPQVRFVSLNVQGTAPAGNLTVIGGQGGRPDYQGFMAGYIAAMMTDEWRVGIISVSDTTAGQQAREGFLTGVPFFCGLCRQKFPPFYEYPIFAEATVASTSEQWQAAADVLVNTSVQTVYLGPGVNDPALMDYLASREMNIIGSSSPSESVRGRWIMSIQPDLTQAFVNALPRLLAGEVLGEINTPLVFTDINTGLLSEGRLAHIEEILEDLQSGIIATQRQ
ncbi:MAG: hypothetical protein DWQ07_04465 [Chloroflexi bacterium]|nr:MAG: hypothetical protein DWQ07_04465 [Chloroflexota bacterium]MBL1194687.1 hypothetical protein [Chloroflexota bacterium]NOH11978.1 hypothetical protein [Chloroflexota bacterium]